MLQEGGAEGPMVIAAQRERKMIEYRTPCAGRRRNRTDCPLGGPGCDRENAGRRGTANLGKWGRAHLFNAILAGVVRTSQHGQIPRKCNQSMAHCVHSKGKPATGLISTDVRQIWDRTTTTATAWVLDWGNEHRSLGDYEVRLRRKKIAG